MAKKIKKGQEAFDEEAYDIRSNPTEEENIEYLAGLVAEGLLSHYKKEVGLTEEDEIDINFDE